MSVILNILVFFSQTSCIYNISSVVFLLMISLGGQVPK